MIHYVNMIWRKFGYIVFLILFWVFYAFLIIHEAYRNAVYISPDSVSYLVEAENLRHGFGFNCAGLKGGEEWFALWPIGYPACIAFFMLLMPGHSSYLASKVLAIAIAGVILAVFGKKYRQDSWIFALLLLNPGLLTINYYSWSEVPFILFLVIFAYGISNLFVKEELKAWHWTVLYIGTMGLFLTRYFGCFALLYLGILWIILVIIYFLKEKRTNAGLWKKIKGLFFTGLLAALGECSYLIVNRIMSGYATGFKRLYFNEDIRELTRELFGALTLELEGAFQQADHPLFRYIGGYTAVCLSFFVFVWLVSFLVKRKKADEAFAFISAGLFYYLIFIIVRYQSSMDTFNYRFFAPATFLITIGMASCIRDFLREKNVETGRYMTGVFVIVLVSAVSLLRIDAEREDAAFWNFNQKIEEIFCGVPSRSLVLNVQVDDTRWPAVRPDIACDSIKEGETRDEMFARAAEYDYVCIKKETVLSQILGNEAYSQSIRDFLQKELEMQQNNGALYIVIPVKR